MLQQMIEPAERTLAITPFAGQLDKVAWPRRVQSPFAAAIIARCLPVPV